MNMRMKENMGCVKKQIALFISIWKCLFQPQAIWLFCGIRKMYEYKIHHIRSFLSFTHSAIDKYTQQTRTMKCWRRMHWTPANNNNHFYSDANFLISHFVFFHPSLFSLFRFLCLLFCRQHFIECLKNCFHFRLKRNRQHLLLLAIVGIEWVFLVCWWLPFSVRIQTIQCFRYFQLNTLTLTLRANHIHLIFKSIYLDQMLFG